MNVGELIDELSRFDRSVPVGIWDYEYDIPQAVVEARIVSHNGHDVLQLADVDLG